MQVASFPDGPVWMEDATTSVCSIPTCGSEFSLEAPQCRCSSCLKVVCRRCLVGTGEVSAGQLQEEVCAICRPLVAFGASLRSFRSLAVREEVFH
jgi:hypothetical protein